MTSTKTHSAVKVRTLVAVMLFASGMAVASAGFMAAGSVIKSKVEKTKTSGREAVTAKVGCGGFPYTADYVVSPTATGPNAYTLPSQALTAAQTQGDLDGNGIIEICLRGGTGTTPNIYLEASSTSVDMKAWSVANGTGYEPVKIFSDSAPELARWQIAVGVTGGSTLTVKNSDTTSKRQLTISHVGFYGEKPKIDASQWMAPNALLILESDIFSYNLQGPVNMVGVLAGGAVKMNIINTKFTGYNSHGLQVYSSADVRLSASEFTGNSTAMRVYDLATVTDQKSVYDGNTESAILITDKASYDGVNVIFRNNHSSSSGGAMSVGLANSPNTSSVSVGCESCVWQNNTSDYNGGAISVVINSTLNFYDNLFIGNSTVLDGGAIKLAHSRIKLDVKGGQFANNTATGGNGGAISALGLGINIAVDSNNLVENTAGASGTISVIGNNSLVIQNSTFEDNHVFAPDTSQANGGGAVFCMGSGENQMTDMLFTDSEFLGNSSTSSGGAVSSLLCNLRGSGNVFNENISASFGGAVKIIEGDFNFNDVVFNHNEAGTAGGALYVVDAVEYGTISVLLSGIEAIGNITKGTGSFLRVEGGEFEGVHINARQNESGGVLASVITLEGVSGAEISNSIFAGNSMSNSLPNADGTILYSGANNQPMVLNNVVIASERNGRAAVSDFTGQVVVMNSIMAYNDGLQILTGPNTSVNGLVLYANPPVDPLLGAQPAFTNGNGNIVADPQFVGDGVTTDPSLSTNILNFDLHLQPGSPAADIDSSEQDADGSPADAGAYGGPDGAW